jgi:hypothetical protein
MTAPRLVLLVLLTACAGEKAPPPEAATQVPDEDSLETAQAADTVLPAMPPYPDRSGGRVTARAVGALSADYDWPGRALRCGGAAPIVFIVGEQPGSGGSVLLRLPPAGAVIGTYPVKFADTAGAPQPPAAQLGFQFFEGNSADAYQAADGSVEVGALDDRHVSGNFAVTVRHIATDRRARIAGVFHDIAFSAPPPGWCDRAAAAQDSLAGGGS